MFNFVVPKTSAMQIRGWKSLSDMLCVRSRV